MGNMIDFKMPVKTNTDSVFDNKGNRLSDILGSNSNKIFPRIYPEDFTGSTLGDKVMAAMEFVKNSNGGFEVYFGNSAEYVVSSAIEIPSNTTLRIKDCTIRMADNIIDNLFRSANIIPDPNNPKGHCLNSQDMEWLENIKIIGENATIIMEDNASQSGALNVGWRGTTLCIVGVNGFEISGLNIQKNLSWSLNIVGCCNGSIHDLTFNTIRENGDGMGILNGSHDITIYNISGITQDDTIDICNFGAARYQKRQAEVNVPVIPINYSYKNFGTDIYNIFIENIDTRGINHVLILITGTHEIYNITAVGLSDTYNNISGKNAVVKIYGGQYCGDYHHGLIHNCSISDIAATNCSTAAVWLSEGVIQNGIIRDIEVPSGRTKLSDQSGVNIADYNMVIE